MSATVELHCVFDDQDLLITDWCSRKFYVCIVNIATDITEPHTQITRITGKIIKFNEKNIQKLNLQGTILAIVLIMQSLHSALIIKTFNSYRLVLKSFFLIYKPFGLNIAD